MFCSNCGNRISDDSKFCKYCGEPVKFEEKDQAKTILLRCKSCNGELSIDDKEKIMCCPYCGSREIILDSDTVKAAQIHAEAYREVELGKQQTAVKLKQMDIDARDREEANAGKSTFKGMLLMLASIGIFILAVEYQNLFGGGAALFITVLCIMMFIAGRRLWKRDKKRKGK